MSLQGSRSSNMLMGAIKSGDVDVVALLLARSADPNLNTTVSYSSSGSVCTVSLLELFWLCHPAAHACR